MTIEKSWMDGSDRSSLVVLTAQSAHSLTADVAARRLYWISDFKKVSSIMIPLDSYRIALTCHTRIRTDITNADFYSVYRDGEGGWDWPLLLHRTVQQETSVWPGCV